MARVKALLQTGLGDPAKGQAIFTGRCAACHKLFDQGGAIGPELTGYDRQSLEFWLLNTTYPSLEIREGFGAYVVKLKDGRMLTGLMDAQGGGSISLKDLAGNLTHVKQAGIEKLEASPISIMPEGLLTGLSDAELKDFFAYLMK
jgi:putative heme-binding domain-containing protein